jgi:multiple sugar transport system ATP-binding protein
MTLADRIVIMNNGRIMQIGDPLDVYNNPKNYFVAGFIGSPAMNLIDVRVKEAAGRPYLSAENFSIAVPESLFGRYQKAEGKEAIWGIRPEHIFDKAFKAPFPGGESLSAIVEVVEPLGSQIILLATCGSFQITACVDPQTRATLRKEKAFIADMNKMHLFDPKTGDVY